MQDYNQTDNKTTDYIDKWKYESKCAGIITWYKHVKQRINKGQLS